jgi:FkbM family methyltransferase
MPFKKVLGLVVSALIGLFLVIAMPAYGPAIQLKISGTGSGCPWPKVFSQAGYAQRLHEVISETRNTIRNTASDPMLPIDRWAVSGLREFWIPRNGSDLDGKALLAYLISDHTVLAEQLGDDGVRPGDIVVDVGAHVGTFADRALRRGARKVIALEPDPLNRECLTRNFATEIAELRMVIVPQGAWSTNGQLTLHQGTHNSGMSSIIHDDGGATFQIEVTTIDEIVQRLGLPHVDFIKMDIEGAEREALKGAADTLRKFRPRMMLDAYHLPDDPVVLPQVIRTANPAYREKCGPCEILAGSLVPHVIIFL